MFGGDAGVFDREGVAADDPTDSDGGSAWVLKDFALARALEHYQFERGRLFHFRLVYRVRVRVRERGSAVAMVDELSTFHF